MMSETLEEKITSKNHISRNKWDWGIAIYIILYGIIVGLINVYFLSLTNSDEPVFISYAERINNGGQYYYTWNPPGISLMILFVSLFTQDYIISAKILAAFFSSTFLYAIYIFIRHIFNEIKSEKAVARPLASLVTLLMSIFPNFMIFTRIGTTDLPFQTFFILTLYFLFQNFKEKKRYLVGAVICAVISSYFRWNGLFFLPFELIIIFIRIRQFEKGKNLTSKEKFNIFWTLCWYTWLYFMLFSPWLAYNYMIHGNIFHNSNLYNFAYDGKRGITPYATVEYASLFDFLQQEWKFFIQKIIINFLIEFPTTFLIQNTSTFIGYYWLKIILALIFWSYFIFAFKKMGQKSSSNDYYISYDNKLAEYYTKLMSNNIVSLVIIILAFILSTAMGWLVLRYITAIYPLVLAVFLYPFVNLRLKKTSKIPNDNNNETITEKSENSQKEIVENHEELDKIEKIPINSNKSIINSSINQFKSIPTKDFFRLMIIFLLIISTIGIFQYSKSIEEHPTEYRRAGEYLRTYEYSNSSQVIVGLNSIYYAYFADMKYDPFLDDFYIKKIEDLMIGLKKVKANYLIVSEFIDLERIPVLEILLDPSNSSNIPIGLENIYNETRDGHALVIYRVI
jgi:hypothetical protein